MPCIPVTLCRCLRTVNESPSGELNDSFKMASRKGKNEEGWVEMTVMTTEQGDGTDTKARKFTWTYQVRVVFLSSWLNILLLFVPAGFIVAYLHVKLVVIFVVNFIAIIPLSGLLGLGMDQLMLQIGDGLTILVWITFWYVLVNNPWGKETEICAASSSRLLPPYSC
jgi:hypothetical protein